MNPVPVFYVDGTEYTLPCSLQRNIRKRESDNSGYLMNGKYHSDYLGTYIDYSVKLAIPIGSESEYANLHELLSNPNKTEYTFTMPYNQEYITFNGKVDVLPDAYFGTYQNEGNNKVTVWRAISFEIQGTEPIFEVETNESSN